MSNVDESEAFHSLEFVNHHHSSSSRHCRNKCGFHLALIGLFALIMVVLLDRLGSIAGKRNQSTTPSPPRSTRPASSFTYRTGAVQFLPYLNSTNASEILTLNLNAYSLIAAAAAAKTRRHPRVQRRRLGFVGDGGVGNQSIVDTTVAAAFLRPHSLREQSIDGD